MATHSSILAWRIPWTQEPGKLQPIGLQRVRPDWNDVAHTHTHTHTHTYSLLDHWVGPSSTIFTMHCVQFTPKFIISRTLTFCSNAFQLHFRYMLSFTGFRLLYFWYIIFFMCDFYIALFFGFFNIFFPANATSF